MYNEVRIPAFTASDTEPTDDELEQNSAIFAAATAQAETALQLWWQADGNYVAHPNDPIAEAVLKAATTSYALTVLVAVHAQAVMDGWSHPAIWVEIDSRTIVDNVGFVEICNDGPDTIQGYQGDSVEYFKADEGNGISQKVSEF